MVQSISAERTLVLPEYSGQTAGLSWPLVWPAKDPNDTNMDFSLDISGWLLEIQDTVGSLQVAWSPDVAANGDLTIVGAFSHNGIITILTDGGKTFVSYTVTLTVTSAILHEVLARNIELPVAPRYGDNIASGGGSISGVVS